jgi:glutathione S-transferase
VARGSSIDSEASGHRRASSHAAEGLELCNPGKVLPEDGHAVDLSERPTFRIHRTKEAVAELRSLPAHRPRVTVEASSEGGHVVIKLYDSAFSPFARKVRMVLEHKGLNFEAVDGLLKSNHEGLKVVNKRMEVPVLVDGDLVIVNSADIVGYLEFRYPTKPVYPEAPAARVHARAWERAADTLVDAILSDISYWKWTDRPDSMPEGLLQAARADLRLVYDALEKDLAHREFVSGPLSIADIALFPHLASVRAMEVEFSAQEHPNLLRWLRQMRTLPICSADLRRARDFVGNLKDKDVERRRIFWRGDRIEWMLARGFHDWFFAEIREQRVLWPGPALPAPIKLRT